MAQNLKLDPVKRDYVVVRGSPIPTDDILEATYYALQIPENNWLYGNPGQGSLIYTLENQKRKPSIEQLYAGYARDSLNRQLVATGKAEAVGIVNLEATRTGTLNKIEVIPAATQIASQLNFSSV